MYRIVNFKFENIKTCDSICGQVGFGENEADPPFIDMEYLIAGRKDKITGHFVWMINGLGIVMLDHNKGTILDEGDFFIEVSYSDDGENFKKSYKGYVDLLDDSRGDFKSIKMLYKFVTRVIEEPQHIQQ